MIIIDLVAIALMIIGLWGMMTQKNLIKLVIAFNIFDTGVNLLIVSVGYIKDRMAPVLDSMDLRRQAEELIVDPVPSAMVLTSIVIGVAITALMLVFTVKYYRRTGSLILGEER